MKYKKNPLNYSEQVERLQSRGLIIEDTERTLRHLSNISYYRLSAYMLPFKQTGNNNSIMDNFRPNTKWNDIYKIYIFDKKLRILIFDYIERLEIAIRTQIIHQLSAKYGAHWQDREDIFKDGNKIFGEIQSHLKTYLENEKNTEISIKKYKDKYETPKNPPSWMSVEIMYFSHLSKICKELNKREDIVNIAKYFNGLPDDIFCSWLHTLNYVRNLCAHHSRLWNRDLSIIPKKYISKKNPWISNPDKVKRKKIYYFLCMINYMLQSVNPNSSFKNRLIDLLDEYDEIVEKKNMGFPDNWKNEAIWKVD